MAGQQTAKIGLDDDDETVSQVEDDEIEDITPDRTRSIDKVDTKKIVERPQTPELWNKARKDIKTAMGMKKGGTVSSASKRADGCCVKGKTKGRMV